MFSVALSFITEKALSGTVSRLSCYRLENKAVTLEKRKTNLTGPRLLGNTRVRVRRSLLAVTGPLVLIVLVTQHCPAGPEGARSPLSWAGGQTEFANQPLNAS